MMNNRNPRCYTIIENENEPNEKEVYNSYSLEKCKEILKKLRKNIINKLTFKKYRIHTWPKFPIDGANIMDSGNYLNENEELKKF